MSRDRDRILEQALKHELRTAGTPPAGGCLDAETLGAWTDGGLDPAAMAAAEAHVSNCARCQALLGTMARGAAITTGTERTLGTEGTPGTFSLWRWWLAPIAAGVTAATLWMVVPEDQQRIATAPPQAKASEAQPVAPAEPQLTAPYAILPAAPPATLAEAQPPLAREDLSAAARDDRQQNKRVEARKEEAPQRQLEERSRLADAAMTPVVPAPPAGVALEAAPAAAPAIGALQKSAIASGGIEVPSPRPSRKWRITPARIERTDDGGATWKLQWDLPNSGFTAGSAPSTVVAWFVGRAGLVAVTSDGGDNIDFVSLAEPLDLASVSATDGRNAAIYSVSGRRFRTTDGGRTWQPF